MQALLHIISLIISELSGDFLSCNVIPLSKTKETNVLFAGFRKMRYAESYESWALS
jgi:hypothetical protein